MYLNTKPPSSGSQPGANASQSPHPPPAQPAQAANPTPTSRPASTSGNAAAPPSSSLGGGTLRPSWEAQREPRQCSYPANRPEPPRPTDSPATTTPSHSHPGPGHHHHHHHHHPHSHTTPAPSAAPASGPPNRDDRPTSSATPTSAYDAKPAPRKIPTSNPMVPPRSYNLGSGSERTKGPLERHIDLERERERQEREREREARRKTNVQTPSPTLAEDGRGRLIDLMGGHASYAPPHQRSLDRDNQTSASAMHHPGYTPRVLLPEKVYQAPTLSIGNTAVSTQPSAAPSAASISPQLPAAATTTTTNARPTLPTPSFSSLGARSLPSPFGGEKDTRERSGSGSVAQPPADHPAPGHQRSASGSSSRGAEIPPGLGLQTSPAKSHTPVGSGISNSMFGIPSLAGNARQGSREVQRSPSTRAPTAASPTQREPHKSPTAPTVRPTAAAPPPVAATAPPSRAPYSFTNPGYNAPSAYTGPFGGFGLGGFGTSYGFNYGRERDRERENREAIRLREREREEKARMDREREDRLRAEKEREEREAWRKDKEASERRTSFGVEAKPFQPPRSNAQNPHHNDPYRRPASSIPDSKYTRHIEVLNRPENAHSTYGTLPPTPAEPLSVMQQVVPSREPRPYGYKTENRDYQYQPRDKRPRMDTAVEEQSHRRGSGTSKSKRKKEDEKKSPALPKDWSGITSAVKKYPDVSSSPVETWLKSVGDLTRVIGREVYLGSEWSLAKTKSAEAGVGNEGGISIVRIGGRFLGKKWKIRGEGGWDDSVSFPECACEISRGRFERRIWGTDVYTDDSDLGMVLVHAGWIRWSNSGLGTEEDETRDGDIINVTVRIVPRLIRYTATERNGVKSRNWGNGHDGLSIVIESVERVKADKKYVNSRANKKMRMSEYGRERQAVLKDDLRKVNGVEPDPPVMFTGLGKPGLKYDPEILTAFINERMEQDDDEVKTIWTHDVVFRHDDPSEEYRLSRCPWSDDELYLSADIPTTFLRYLSLSDAMFVKDGLAVRSGVKQDGVLYPVRMYRWEKREEKRYDEIDEFTLDYESLLLWRKVSKRRLPRAA
ncbi:hypothetical protein P7C73_g4550, partial [Tremellales sp. Uapishka_1]